MTSMRILLIFILGLLLAKNFGFAQSKLGNEWITGPGGTKIKFSSGNITMNQNHYYWTYFHKGNSSICDTNGNLIIACDGFNVYDSAGNYIDNGDSLVPHDLYVQQNGWNSISQGSIILPVENNKYYLFTPCFSDSQQYNCNNFNICHDDLFLYHVIDMNANAGAGKVVKRMQPLMQNARLSKTQMMACRHGNGKDWWLLKQGSDSNIVYKFLVTQDSIYDYGRQVFNEPLWGTWDTWGQSAFSLDGKKYTTTVQALANPGKIAVFDFDRCSGNLSNLYVLQAPQIVSPTDSPLIDMLTTGLAYSPNGKYLYVTLHQHVFQYDTFDSTWYLVAQLDTTPNQFQLYSTIYLAPDNKLYIGNFGGLGKHMSRIDNPDIKGAGCNFCPVCLKLDSLGSLAWAGTPPCMPNFNLGEDSLHCWPLQSESLNTERGDWSVFPNPTSNIFYIKNADGKRKELYSLVGEFLLAITDDKMNVSNLPKGIYFLRCENRTKKILIE